MMARLRPGAEARGTRAPRPGHDPAPRVGKGRRGLRRQLERAARAPRLPRRRQIVSIFGYASWLRPRGARASSRRSRSWTDPGKRRERDNDGGRFDGADEVRRDARPVHDVLSRAWAAWPPSMRRSAGALEAGRAILFRGFGFDAEAVGRGAALRFQFHVDTGSPRRTTLRPSIRGDHSSSGSSRGTRAGAALRERALGVAAVLLWFWCERPAAEGGATTICDGVRLWEALSPQTQRLFQRERVAYGAGGAVPTQAMLAQLQQSYLAKDSRSSSFAGRSSASSTTTPRSWSTRPRRCIARTSASFRLHEQHHRPLSRHRSPRIDRRHPARRHGGITSAQEALTDEIRGRPAISSCSTTRASRTVVAAFRTWSARSTR